MLVILAFRVRGHSWPHNNFEASQQHVRPSFKTKQKNDKTLLFVLVIVYYAKAPLLRQLRERRVYVGLQFQRDSSPWSIRHRKKHNRWSLQLRTRVLNLRLEAEGANSKQLKSSPIAPAVTHSVQQGHTPPTQTSTATWEHAFKCPRLWGPFLIQTTTLLHKVCV